MPRRTRVATGGVVYHVLNRRVGRATLFKDDQDYAAFERVLAELVDRLGTRLLAYGLMPNHWHMLLWPRADGELSEFMRLVTVTHTQRWHAQRRSAGQGPVYQGRFKSFPVQADEHFLMAARYVEGNALRAGLVDRAQEWPWGSLWLRRQRAAVEDTPALADWPVDQPRAWARWVNQPQSEAELAALRVCVNRGGPFGRPAWVTRTARRLGLESALRPIGRPRKQSTTKPDA